VHSFGHLQSGRQQAALCQPLQCVCVCVCTPADCAQDRNGYSNTSVVTVFEPSFVTRHHGASPSLEALRHLWSTPSMYVLFSSLDRSLLLEADSCWSTHGFLPSSLSCPQEPATGPSPPFCYRHTPRHLHSALYVQVFQQLLWLSNFSTKIRIYSPFPAPSHPPWADHFNNIGLRSKLCISLTYDIVTISEQLQWPVWKT